MSRLVLKNINNNYFGEPFNKEKIIQEIREMLPNPWVWYTLKDCMEEYGKPNYDLVLMRHKDVNEEVRYTGNPFTSVKNMFNNIYSLVIGVHVVDKFTSQKTFQVTEEFATAAVEVSSSLMLFDLIKNIDCKAGGIRNDN